MEFDSFTSTKIKFHIKFTKEYVIKINFTIYSPYNESRKRSCYFVCKKVEVASFLSWQLQLLTKFVIFHNIEWAKMSYVFGYIKLNV